MGAEIASRDGRRARGTIPAGAGTRVGRPLLFAVMGEGALPYQSSEVIQPGTDGAFHMINVIIADASEAARAGVREALSRTGDIRVAGEAADCVATLALVRHRAPEVLLVGPGIGTACFAQIPRVKRLAARVRVLVVVPDAHGREIEAAFRAGASGCVTADVLPHDVAEAIRVLAQGGVFVAATHATMPAAQDRAGRNAHP